MWADINHLVDSDLRNASPAFLVGGKGPRISKKLTPAKAV